MPCISTSCYRHASCSNLSLCTLLLHFVLLHSTFHISRVMFLYGLWLQSFEFLRFLSECSAFLRSVLLRPTLGSFTSLRVCFVSSRFVPIFFFFFFHIITLGLYFGFRLFSDVSRFCLLFHQKSQKKRAAGWSSAGFPITGTMRGKFRFRCEIPRARLLSTVIDANDNFVCSCNAIESNQRCVKARALLCRPGRQ